MKAVPCAIISACHGRRLRHADDVQKPGALLRRSLLATGAAFAAPSIARGQSELPDRTLRIFVGFAAGGGTDVKARLIARGLERRVGRHIVVENRPGGTGAAAGEALKSAPPDGASVAFMPSVSLAAKLVVPNYPIDPMVELVPITVVGTFQTAIAVSPKIGVSSFSEYITWLKAGGPERRRFGITGDDAFTQYYVRLIGRETATPLQGVPYRGAATMVADLEQGRIPAGASGITSLLEHHRGRRVRIVLTSGAKRVSVAPDLPTASELGHPALEMLEWYGFFAIRSTPRRLIDAWNRELRALLASREITDELAALGLEVETTTPDEAAAEMATYLQRWKSLLAAFGMKTTN